MKIEITYPVLEKRTLQRRRVIEAARWPFLAAAYICPIVNICTGGPAWSVVVLWSLLGVWSLALSPDLVQYNRISQFIKGVANAMVLMILIDVLLSPGWALDVVPIVCFGATAVAGVLFFTDFERQRQNMLPMLLLSGASALSSAACLIIWRDQLRWALLVMGALAIALWGVCFIVLRGDMLRELKKSFHTR